MELAIKIICRISNRSQEIIVLPLCFDIKPPSLRVLYIKLIGALRIKKPAFLFKNPLLLMVLVSFLKLALECAILVPKNMALSTYVLVILVLVGETLSPRSFKNRATLPRMSLASEYFPLIAIIQSSA
jgi:hypothetical protein